MIAARNPQDGYIYLYCIKPPKSWSQEKTTDLLFWCLDHLRLFTEISHKCDEIPEEFAEAFIQQQ